MSAKNSSSKAAKATNILHTIPGAIYRLIYGDCIAAMMTLMACSIAAIVCDPPYGIAYGNKHFDILGDAKTQRKWHKKWARQAFRVLKPGGYLLAFSATRTVQNLTVALEKAGFEIAGQIAWHHAQGGPHSDTTLKASHEVIVMARKPHLWNLKTNGATSGTGPLQLDAAKVGPSATVTDPSVDMATVSLEGLEAKVREMSDTVLTHHEDCEMVERLVPVNAKSKVCPEADAVATRTLRLWRCVEGCPCRTLNEDDPKFQARAARNAVVVARSNLSLNVSGETETETERLPVEDIIDGTESGMLFYSKPSSKEKHAGLDHLPTKLVKNGTGLYGKEVAKKNTHPTVKPIALMAHLLRLVLPNGGTVLDPFAGSGSTGCAVGQENAKPNGLGWQFIGIEADFDGDGFIAQAAGRITHWSGGAQVSVERHDSADDIELDLAARKAEKASKAARKARGTGSTRTTTRTNATRTGRQPRTASARRAARRTTTGPAKGRAATASAERATKATAQKPVIAPAPTREAETNGGPTQTDTKVTKPATEEPAPAARRPKAKPTPAAAPSKPRTAPPARANAAAADDQQRQQDLYFLNIAATVRDVPPGGFDAPGTRPTANPNGAVLVAADGRVISTGYDSTLTTGGGCLHAELVAILNAARSAAPVEGATLYTTCRPCIDCMQAAIHAGVKRIVFLEDASACLTAKTRAEYSILARLLNEFVRVEDPTGRAQPARRTQQRE